MIVSERVRALLAAHTRFTQVYEWSKLDSTNRWLLAAAAQGAPEGTVAVADEQTAGRGRLDRRWEAPAGTGLLLSVLLRPAGLAPAHPHLLSVAVGLAARAACEQVGGFVPELKWPNDLEVDGAKLAGVLAQAQGAAVVVGIGCNVAWSPPGALDVQRCAGRPVDRGELLAALLLDLDTRLAQPPDLLAAQYRAACATIGRRVRVELGDGRPPVVGRAEGLDDDGHLLVRPEPGGGPAPGGLKVVAVGDVVHLRALGRPGDDGDDW